MTETKAMTAFICKQKVIGYAFVVLSEELADKWVSSNPENHYYEEVPIAWSVEL